ncbi:apolipoprotein N-acyltransferase [Piscinibacter sakaiensis]|uniref:apolipoprotein N-acyltransferase n=1 Tax=Piscinibacter sakaiensis TaxID=1547922 RepID=UPI0006B58BFE|nr:apolipoprotein N-acyltransferase [Piscinibacter sakaiensis]
MAGRLPAGAAPPRGEWLGVAVAGAGHTLAYEHTAAWPLALLAIAWLAARVARAGPGRAALLGGVYGTAWLAAGTWWLFISMHRYGGLPAWMAAAAVLALSAFLSLYLAAAMAAVARWRRGRPLADALLFAAAWLLAELARGVVFTGFPWVAAGYAQVDGPLAALAPWVGVYGLGAVGAALAAGIGFAWAGPRRAGPAPGEAAAASAASGAGAGARARRAVRPLLAALAVLGLLALLPVPDFSRPSGPRPLGVALLQGNVPQDEKFAAGPQAAAIEWHVRALLDARGPQTDLVIAPETALVLLPEQMPEGFWAGLQQAFAQGPTHALVGVPWGDEASGYTNSALGLAPGRAAGAPDYRYDKHHLVPFGEFIPAGFRWFTRMMNIPLGDFARGPLVAPSMPVNGERIAPNICYEDLFGEELAARFRDPAQAPTVLANLSNIGWFGDSPALPQHLGISRMRSLELQRPMLRATNTGVTAVIDHRGRVTARLAPFTRGVLRARVEGREGLTPYAAWASRAGLWPLALAALTVIAAAAWRGRRAAAGPGGPR